MLFLFGVVVLIIWSTAFKGPGEKPVRVVDVQISSLETAIQHYLADYDHLPDIPETISGERDNAQLIAVLMARSNQPVVAKNNPRNIAYMEDTLTNSAFLDPWGHPYHFSWDEKTNAVETLRNSRHPVRIWSDGKNGRNENGSGDDPHNWK